MAYSNVGRPRFYIDLFQHLKSLGLQIRVNDDKYLDLLNLDPTSTTECHHITIKWASEFDVDGNIVNQDETFTLEMSRLIIPEQAYFALLNHDISFGDGGSNLETTCHVVNPNTVTEVFDSRVEVLNATDTGIGTYPALANQNGSTIMTGDISGWTSETGDFSPFNKARLEVVNNSRNLHLGAFSMGGYFDMPVSPDLDLSMTVEFDGYDSTTTLGGSTLTNVRYAGSPWWYDVDGNKTEPFSVGASSGLSKRNGRRMWSMKFSYMSDKDIFASNYMSNTYLETSTDYESDDLTTDSNNFEYTLENDNSFIAQVLNKVGNGQRFIFQPDNTNNNPDQFAICQLDQDSLQIKQVAYKVYDISLKIREVW